MRQVDRIADARGARAGLNDIMSDAQLLCSVLSYGVVPPCGDGATPEPTCGALPTHALVDQQALATSFSDATLLQADAASSTLYVAVQQTWAMRALRVTGYLKRGAALIVPDLTLCNGALVVHVTDGALGTFTRAFAAPEQSPPVHVQRCWCLRQLCTSTSSAACASCPSCPSRQRRLSGASLL